MDNVLFSGRHITAVTNHRSEASLKTYTGYTTSKKRKEMSHALTRATAVPEEAKKRRFPTHTVTLGDLDHELSTEPQTTCQNQALPHIEIPPELDDIMNVDFETLTQYNTTIQNNNTVEPLPVSSNLPSLPTMNNCSNITFNFNFGPGNQ